MHRAREGSVHSDMRIIRPPNAGRCRAACGPQDPRGPMVSGRMLAGRIGPHDGPHASDPMRADTLAGRYAGPYRSRPLGTRADMCGPLRAAQSPICGPHAGRWYGPQPIGPHAGRCRADVGPIPRGPHARGPMAARAESVRTTRQSLFGGPTEYVRRHEQIMFGGVDSSPGRAGSGSQNSVMKLGRENRVMKLGHENENGKVGRETGLTLSPESCFNRQVGSREGNRS